MNSQLHFEILFRAMHDLAHCHATGAYGAKKKPSKARTLLLKSAQAGYADSQTRLATLYAEGGSTEYGWFDQSYEEALKWLFLAADQGNPLAYSELAKMYLEGHGVSSDENEALRFASLAAFCHNSDSFSILHDYYENAIIKVDIRLRRAQHMNLVIYWSGKLAEISENEGPYGPEKSIIAFLNTLAQFVPLAWYPKTEQCTTSSVLPFANRIRAKLPGFDWEMYKCKFCLSLKENEFCLACEEFQSWSRTQTKEEEKYCPPLGERLGESLAAACHLVKKMQLKH